MKKAGFSFLHSKVSWNQSPDAVAKFREDPASFCATLTQQELCKLHAFSVIFIPPLGYHTGNHGAHCNLSPFRTIKWNQQIVFRCLGQNKEKKNNQNTFTMFDLLAVHCCFSVILWVWRSDLLHHMVSCWPGHAAAPYWNTGSAGVWCLTCLTSRSEDGSELFNNALMDRTTGNPLS